MQIHIVESLKDIEASAWNHLVDDDFPFVRYEFLRALEEHDAVGEKYGWYPKYLLAMQDRELVAAVPLYLKDNSYGEFVFDWAWADAYHRAGVDYYPKLVSAIPYTPASGPRLLLSPDIDAEPVARQLIDAASKHAEKLGVSSLHWLFTDERDTEYLRQDERYYMRMGCQFHWHNKNYKDFDDYLAAFSSKKRKQIKRERRVVQQQGIEIQVLQGDEVSDEQWAIYHHFYCSTFERKSGMPTLSLEFFKALAESMPENLLLVFAKYENEYIASAFNVKGNKTLYGRHWGCSREFANLHFEACYYQGLEYCIENELQRFEPGAQGEHKIWRGFLPAPTWSAHWLAHPQFSKAIGQFLEHETEGMLHYIEELNDHSPFKGT